MTSVSKERRKAANERETAGIPPKNKARTSTPKQKRDAALADIHEKADVGNQNRLVTKSRWIVEQTNQTVFKCFKRLELRMHWKHIKHLDDDLKATAVLWNLYRWKRTKWNTSHNLDKQDIDEMARRISMPLPIFKLLDQDDFSTRWFKLSRFPVFTRTDIRRECCGMYGVKRAEEYIEALGYTQLLLSYSNTPLFRFAAHFECN